MAGFTLIHLSDLHIGSKLSADSFRALADFTAESLGEDFLEVASKHAIPFRPEETFLVITGDITQNADWGQYEVASHFLHKLQSQFGQRLNSGELPSDHIICIPGNHDIEVPAHEKDVTPMQRKTKFRNFKLFLDEITNHSPFASNFTLANPFVNVHIPTPFRMQMLDLNTSLNISCYSKEELGSKSSLTLDHLRNLDVFLNVREKAFRIALLHHPIAEFPSEDISGVSQSTLRDWLIGKGFKIVLCGHTHVAAGQRSIPVLEEKSLLELGTGYSFLPGMSSAGNFYQIIRIEPSDDNRISLVRRVYSWRTNSLDKSRNYWEAEMRNNPVLRAEVSDLNGNLGSTDYRNFIGIPSPHSWAVVAHCESGKFQKFGVLSPGEKVNANLLEVSGFIEGHLEKVDEDSEVEWNKYSGKSALFLVDSPHYNPYVNSILKTYGTYLAGGVVQFVDERVEKPLLQRIQIYHEKVTSNKNEDMKLFDEFIDYVLIMRLPGFVPRTGDSEVEMPDIDKNRVIWVIAGIHSKASYAGAMLFTPRNLQLFTNSLQQNCGGKLPEYFEAVYKTPNKPEKIDHFQDLELVHLKTLRLKSELGIADDLPSGVAVRFLNKGRWETIPISTVHFDPVAACNFICPNCIEDHVRQRKLFLSMSTCVSILCDLHESGCQNLNFYGGEPTLHPDFDGILRLSSQLGFDMLLVTNGSLFANKRIADAIVNARNRIHVRVSIDAHSVASHQRNHGLSETDDCFNDIVVQTEQLIKQGVSVTISFLLHKNSISEIENACKFWREKHASAFILRPVTEQFGKAPKLAYDQDEKNVISRVINDHEGFAFAAAWFQNWINEDTPFVERKKDYDKCFSGHYRVAISPFDESGNSQISSIGGVEMTEVNKAWISLCTYRRYDPDFGCEYPKNLKTWCQTRRQEALARINPSKQCDGIVCCRHEYNKQIQDLISITAAI